MVRRFFQSEVRDRGTGYRRTAAVPGAAPVHHQHRVAHGPAVLVRGASPIRRVGQTSSRRADRHTGTPWPPSMGSGIPTTRRPVCGARRRPPYCTKMTRDMGTSSNALRITWFGQRHLTSTLRPIIARRTELEKCPHRGGALCAVCPVFVVVQDKCPPKRSAKMSPVYWGIVSDVDTGRVAGDRRVGGLSASMYRLEP